MINDPVSSSMIHEQILALGRSIHVFKDEVDGRDLRDHFVRQTSVSIGRQRGRTADPFKCKVRSGTFLYQIVKLIRPKQPWKSNWNIDDGRIGNSQSRPGPQSVHDELAEQRATPVAGAPHLDHANLALGRFASNRKRAS